MKQLQKANYKILDKTHNFKPPKKMIFDLDSTSFKTYGQQHGAKYNSHYGTNGYHPLLMFDGVAGDLIKAQLRSGNVYTSRKAVRFVGPIFKKYKKMIKKIPVYLRADSGFAKPGIYKMLKEHMKQLQKANYKLLDRIHNFKPPKEMIFDLDSTSFKTYGQ